MSKLLQHVLHSLQGPSVFDNYYASVLKRGAPGAPTADEARRDLARRYANYVNLRSM